MELQALTGLVGMSVIQVPFATPTPVRWVSPAALPILRAALRLLALPNRLPLRVLPLDPAVGGAAGYAGRGSAGRLEQVIAGEANASAFGHQHPLFQQLLAHAVVAVALDGRHGVQAAARTGQHHEAFLRSDEHPSELQSLMRISYAVFCLKKK